MAFICTTDNLRNKLNNSGDKAHPWRRQHAVLNQIVYRPLIFTHDATEWYKDFTTMKKLPFMPMSGSVFHSRLRYKKSYAFRKSIKAQMACLDFFLVSIVFVNADTWSMVFLCFLKPFCSSANIFQLSDEFDKLLLKTEKSILYIEDNKAVSR